MPIVMGYPSRENPSLPCPVFLIFLLLCSNLLTFFWSSILNYNYCPSNSSENTLKPRSSQVAEEDLPFEFVAFAYGEKLPFGFNPRFDSDTLYSSVGRTCSLYKDDLRRYMTYVVNGSCPDDEQLAQKLLLKGCEPLPRRRCRPAAASVSEEPIPFPNCLWSTPRDSSVVWTAYTCKNYQCLIDRRLRKGSDDCIDCFYLEGREKMRWLRRPDGNDRLEFSIDEVLALKRPGAIRIGLDIGGGAGTFACRFFLTVSQRLPFFDNTLDIVHSMHVLSNWIPTTLFHFLLFDIYRVLRPGGLFWLDHFFCEVDQWEVIYKPLIEGIGFRKLKWVTGSKRDNPALRELYLSALLEKPLKNSW
ncbi:hypothetical protein Nepgr_008964 [Nepenthes gracilis]|uniref:Methyltransferase type 11 domain-containing protein n=1 Tax=Nepenthes gracilis TaxID=150966 RepID=A0AAD3XJT5_NEPGR|nr:hypothetical protein Nepgr_008964 [Nepenthes gracilis]